MATSLEDAFAAIDAAIEPLAVETVETERAAGRTTAEPVLAPMSLPPFPSSAMDGFTFRAADTATASAERPARLRLLTESRAGSPAATTLAPGQAARISTGAMPPEGADAVLRVEDGEIEDGTLLIGTPIAVGSDLRPAGDDVFAGDEVAPRGTVIDAGTIAAFASLGLATIRCTRRPSVAIVGTGDELVPIGRPLGPGQIHDSSSSMLIALVEAAGAEVASITRAVADDRDATIAALRAALEGADMLLISGGVSVGAHDHVKPALAALGAREIFWRIKLRPGRPTWFGLVDDVPVLGLPGNPASSYVIFQLLGQRALNALTGTARSPLTITARYRGARQTKRAGLIQAMRCRLASGAPDEPWAEAVGRHQKSNALSSLVSVDGLVLLGEEVTALEDGELVSVQLV